MDRITHRCWCGTPSSYDSYGSGICNFECTGSSESTCGGDYAFSLYIIYGDGGGGGTDDQGDDDGGIGGDECVTYCVKSVAYTW